MPTKDACHPSFAELSLVKQGELASPIVLFSGSKITTMSRGLQPALAVLFSLWDIP
jgi:hypothetical protein